MKIEINLKGEIIDKEFANVRAELESLKKYFEWYKCGTNYEELKQK